MLKMVSTAEPLETARKIRSCLWSHEGLPTLRYHAGEWWRWKGTHYENVSHDEIKSDAYLWFSDAKVTTKDGGIEPYRPTPRKVNDVLDCLKAISLARCGEMPCYLGNDPFPVRNVIPLRNGILDVDAYIGGQPCLRAHTPLWFSPTCLPFAYDPEARCPRWEAFVADVMGGDMESVRCLQEWVGCNLVPETRYQTIMILLGSGRNGKGVFTRALMGLIGRENYCTPTLSRLGSRFGCQEMIGKLAAIFPDAHLGRGADATGALEVLKAVSGEDPVTIDRKNKEPLTGVHLTTRFTIVANEMPHFSDSSQAIGRRVITIPFHQNYTGREDRDLEAKLAEERPGILLWALQGLMRLRARGNFLQPEAGESLKDDFDADSSPIATFQDECCEVGPGLRERKEVMRRCVNSYLAGKGHKPMSEAAITRKLRAVNSRIEPCRAREAGQRAQFYSHVQINEDDRQALLQDGAWQSKFDPWSE
jgi:putative DNA primase/helicase